MIIGRGRIENVSLSIGDALGDWGTEALTSAALCSSRESSGWPDFRPAP